MKTSSSTLVVTIAFTVAWCIASTEGNPCTIQMVTRNYTYLQVAATRSLVGPDQLMTFTVLTCNDATLLLSENSTDQTNNIFEIVLGGWTNSKSVIRNATQGSALVSTSHSPLSCTATRAFYIRWDLNILRIGNLTGQSGAWTPASPFLTWNITSTHKINYVFVASWDKPGNWTFDNCSSLTSTYSSGQTASGTTTDITCCSDQVNATTAEITTSTPAIKTTAETTTTTSTKSSSSSTTATTPISSTTLTAETITTTTSTTSSTSSTTATTPISSTTPAAETTATSAKSSATSTTTTALVTAAENTVATWTTASGSQVSTNDNRVSTGATADGSASTMSVSSHSTTSDTKQCACGCKMVTSVNLSSLVLEESIRHLVGELKVQPKNTFAYSQRLNSAHDPRVSSGAIGIVGIVCMVLPFGFILCLDLVDLQRFLFQKSSRCCK